MYLLRMTFCALFCVTGLPAPASADPTNLCGGVFIAHHVPELSYSGGEDLCADYELYAIHSAEEQYPCIDLPPDLPAVWYVISAWDEEKEWCGTQFGFGDYDASRFVFADWGIYSPGEHLEITGDDWPGPNEGTAFTSIYPPWSGNYIPVYWFAGYAYGETVIPLDEDPSAGIVFGGWANCLGPPEAFAAEDYGAMGIHMPGIAVSPSGGISPVQTTSWGKLKSLYR